MATKKAAKKTTAPKEPGKKKKSAAKTDSSMPAVQAWERGESIKLAKDTSGE